VSWQTECVRLPAHSNMLLVDHLMARSGFSTHPLEDYNVQDLDHSQLAAM
jgi:hypothetical protein